MTIPGLLTQEVEKTINVFRKHPEMEQAILFGSRAGGNYKPWSDIDLTLVGENINLTILQKIEVDIDDLMMPYKCDLSLKRHISNGKLIEHIEKSGIKIYNK